MGIRTGKQVLDGMRDDREVWSDGARVRDVTTDPRFAGGARTLAELYDLQNEPDLIDSMTYESPTSGERVGLSFIEPRSADDLTRRRVMVKTWNDYTCGMYGRSPDFMNVMITGFAAAEETFAAGGKEFGQNIRNYYHHIRENDVATTHALVSPQVDRSKPLDQQEKDISARIVRETDAGIVIHGARMLATLAAFADDLVVMPAPSYPLPDTDEAKAHAYGFAIPSATKGLKYIARPSVMQTNAGSPMDFPLASRFDDSDCMVIFDNVLVPWERVFIYRDVDVYNHIYPRTLATTQTAHQYCTKDWAKAEFMMGLGFALARSTNVDSFLHIQGLLTELINIASFVRSSVIASEVETEPGPGDTVLPRRWALEAVRFMYPPMFRRSCEIIQTIGAGGLMMVPSYAELDGPMAEEVERYFQAANADSKTRIKMFRLACDAAVTSFSGRQQLYERYFAGDPVRAAGGVYNAFDKEPALARITELHDALERRIDREDPFDGVARAGA